MTTSEARPALGDVLNRDGHAWMVTSFWFDGGYLLTSIPDGMTPNDLGRRFFAATLVKPELGMAGHLRTMPVT